jgi:hypothetical protein
MAIMHSTHGAEILQNELIVLSRAKEANPLWFHAVLMAAKVQASRRRKYSGQEDDPYENFYRVAQLRRQPTDTEDIFEFYQDVKMARVQVDQGDHDDESLNDTLIDLANYCLLEVGFRCRNSTSSARARALQTTFLTKPA